MKGFRGPVCDQPPMRSQPELAISGLISISWHLQQLMVELPPHSGVCGQIKSDLERHVPRHGPLDQQLFIVRLYHIGACYIRHGSRHGVGGY
ncbi:hypothetical protein PpBr36_08523 [Pyricularia pennisetigena]|uniref:hypothetical protein n=1 Tax=Pyricularia pennisetigena TaxID=1578925 RepID=UPI0011545BF4|nr:hypothetical protein PpBr36_08523 [Pyricularia pennisetigena]TLS24524.1 hypothetical protein PpBr36_08523 [Pyricularia pennisetigena]